PDDPCTRRASAANGAAARSQDEVGAVQLCLGDVLHQQGGAATKTEQDIAGLVDGPLPRLAGGGEVEGGEIKQVRTVLEVRDRVLAAVWHEDERVGTAAAGQAVVVGAAVERVGTGAATQHVVSAVSADHVLTASAAQRVVACFP